MNWIWFEARLPASRRYVRVVHCGTPVRENWIETLPSAPLLTGLPIVVHVPPLSHSSFTGTSAWAGSSTPSAVAVVAHSLPVQSRWMSSVTFGDGAIASTSVRSLLAFRAKTFLAPVTL
jgi:hypothetical protein